MEKLIWQQSRFHCEVSVWGPEAGVLIACCGSVCPVPHHRQAIPSPPYARYPVIRPKKNGISHTLLDPGLLCPHPSTHGARGWVVGSATASGSCPSLFLWPLLFACGQISRTATNQQLRACCVMILSGLNFVKLVTNLNSRSLRVPIITLGALRD